MLIRYTSPAAANVLFEIIEIIIEVVITVPLESASPATVKKKVTHQYNTLSMLKSDTKTQYLNWLFFEKHRIREKLRRIRKEQTGKNLMIIM